MFFRKRREARAEARWKAQQEVDRAFVAEQQAERERELVELLHLADRGDIEAQERAYYVLWKPQGTKLARRWEANAKRVNIREEYDKLVEPLTQAVWGWREARDTDQEIEVLTKLVQLYRTVEYPQNLTRLYKQTGVRRKLATKHLKELVRTLYNKLLANSGDSAEAFAELRMLIRRTHHSYSFSGGKPGRWYRIDNGALPVPPLPYPGSWDELAARHLNADPLEKFRAMAERHTGDLLMMVRRAMHAQDVEEMQTALECCRFYEQEPHNLIMPAKQLAMQLYYRQKASEAATE